MKYYFLFTLLIYLLFTNFFSNAQERLYSTRFMKAASYSDRAELEICRNNLKLADKYYDSLFLVMPNPSGRDVWNRAILAREIGKKVLHDSLVRILYFKGYSFKQLAKCFDTLIVCNLMSLEYLAKRRTIERYYDNLLEEDQRANKNKYEHPREWVDTWISNIQTIMELAKKAESDPSSYFTIESSVPQVCFLHFFQMWAPSFNQSKSALAFIQNNPRLELAKSIDFKALGVVPFLVDQVEKGNFDRTSVAYYLNLTEVHFPYQVTYQFDNDVLILNPNLLRRGLLDTINSNRQFLGVCSFQEYFVKARYTDSLFTDGKPFRPISKNIESFDINEENKCVYKIADGSRTTLFFIKPEDAKWSMEEEKKKYFRSDKSPVND